MTSTLPLTAPPPPVCGSNFRAAFCAQSGVDLAAFEQAVLRRTLYPHARVLAPLCRFFNRNFFAADLNLIRSVSGFCQGHHFSAEGMDFSDDPANQSFWRQGLLIRVSVRRLFMLIQTTLPIAKGPLLTVPATSDPIGASLPASPPLR